MTDQAVAQAAESASLTRARFEQELALSKDLIDAETALVAARVRRAEAEADRQIAIAAVRKALALPQLESTIEIKMRTSLPRAALLPGVRSSGVGQPLWRSALSPGRQLEIDNCKFTIGNLPFSFPRSGTRGPSARGLARSKTPRHLNPSFMPRLVLG